MIDLTIFEDSTIKRLIIGIIAGLTLGIIAEIVLDVSAGSAYMPVVFFGVLIVVLAVLVRWSNGLE